MKSLSGITLICSVTHDYRLLPVVYDSMKRVVRTLTPGGTIQRTVFHARGWVLEEWTGTDDSGATPSDPSGSGSNNMVKVRSFLYDGGVAKGDGNRTRQTEYVSPTSGDTRVTNYQYDFRNRLSVTDGEIDFCETSEYDNQNQVTRVERWNTYKPSGSSSSGSGGQGNLIARSETKFDLLGRVYRSTRYGVDPTTGTVGNGLDSDTWYDGRGAVWKQQGLGSNAYQRMFYDGLRRTTKSYVAYLQTSPSGEIVMEQLEVGHDAASNLIQQVVRKRFHDATGTGELTNPNGAQPKARVTYTASWHDALGRQIAIATYGTNQANSWSRPSTIPARSDTVLVTSTEYNVRGEAQFDTNPGGIIKRQVFDDAGHLAKSVLDYSSSQGHLNRESEFVYNVDGKMTSSTRKNSETGDQTTTYTYGTTLSDSDVASNSLLRRIVYPDSGGDTDDVEFKYNRLGQAKEKKDQIQSVNVYQFDKLGRLVHDRVTTLGSGLDGTVRRITYSYEVRGMISGLASYSSATVGSGTVVNDVKLEYNSFGQVSKEYQSHSGAVNTGSTPKVQYSYANGADNHVRPTNMIYPNGRTLVFDYGTSDAMDDILCRVQKLKISTTVIVTYTYVGVENRVRVQFNEPGAELTYILQGSESPGDGGDQYTGWDRFGRVIDQRWLKTSSGDALERVQYGFDRRSNRQYRHNAVAPTFGKYQDEYYAYDNLSQVLSMERGQLNTNVPPTGIQGTPSREEDFTYDPIGNWGAHVVKVSGATTLNQTRSHTLANEIDQIDSSSSYIGHDLNGNTTKAPKTSDWQAALDLTYDAWNRLVKVMSGVSTLGTYRYDGRHRRVTNAGASTRHYYYSRYWQIVEERVGTSTSAERQFTWGLRYVDDLVCRDKSSERLYALQDYFQPTAVLDTSCVVKERYDYDTFGQVRFMKADFDSRASSSYGWETLFGAYRWDSESGLYQVRFRYLHPKLGRWLSRDPVRERGGINLYCYLGNDAVGAVDALGLWEWTEASAVRALNIKAAEFVDKGWGFAASLLVHFVNEGGPTTYIGTNADNTKVKSDKRFRAGLKSLMQRLADGRCLSDRRENIIHLIKVNEAFEWDTANSAFEVEYVASLPWGELFYALATAHFGVKGNLIVDCCVGEWKFNGKVRQQDVYSFPEDPVREIFPSYSAALYLEQIGYTAFEVRQEWDDAVEGVVYASSKPQI